MKLLIIFSIISFTIITNFAQIKLKLPAIFSDNMVLQQESDVPFWGNAKPNSTITVTPEWGEPIEAVVQTNSTWSVKVKTPTAGGPYKIIISDGNEKIEYKNVLVGEVWLCSGQSNMEMPLEGWPPNDIIENSAEEIANSENNNIRFFTVQRNISGVPKDDCSGNWVESSPRTASTFSATVYFFGKKLYNELNVPIGLIHSSWGGTPVESWISKEYLSQINGFDSTLKKIDLSAPAIVELNNWLNSLPQINITEKTDENIWSGLEFNDSECSQIDYNHSEWAIMKLPTLWEQTELGEFDGAVWFRKIVELPDSWINKKLTLELGPIDDFDITFVNGSKVGGIEKDGNWQTKRKYTVPSDINNQNKLLIAVRVNDIRGGGGIYGKPEEMKLVNTEDQSEISLAGNWFYLPVAEFKGMIYYVFGGKDMIYKQRPKLPVELSAYTPTLLYNGMISPLMPFGIKGVIWYQGEANTGNPKLYETLFPTLIKNWRNDFQIDFPFYYVQIAPYDYGNETHSEFLRDAQRKTLSLENTGMVVTLDIGNNNNIHPANKKDVGERLAFWALAKQYNNNIAYSGPLYKSMDIKENTIELKFDHVGSGLEIRDGENQFLIAGENKNFVTAETKIVKNTLIVWSDKINEPLAVRYAWSNTAKATLFNKEGLPASSFRTDSWDNTHAE